MSKFNKKKAGTKTTNLAGGKSYKESPELELVSLLLTSFVKDQYYRDSGTALKQLEAVVKKLPDLSFGAKAGIYARTEFGMRSITHALASIIANEIKGQGVSWGKSFFNKVVYRTDDITEILANYFDKYSKDKKRAVLPNALKKGLAKAFDKFDAYQIAKYKGGTKEVSLLDAINLVRPRPTEKNAEALKKLVVDNKLSSDGTWETKLTKAGQTAKTEEEKEKFKADAWKELVGTRKIGYFALLRNLRNIAEQSPDMLDKALDMLRDEKLIKKSLVLPFRFYTAYKEFKNSRLDRARDIMVAIDDAVEISLNNVPKFDGSMLVALDDSGSMGGFGYGDRDKQTPIEIGALFAAVLVKTNNCDFLMFSDDARYVNVNPKDSVMTITEHIAKNNHGGGTDFGYPFTRAKKKYDRIILMSDMQGWKETSWGWGSSGVTAPKAFKTYQDKYGVGTHLYSFDLAGYGTLEFPENQVYCLAGFSDKVFDMMKLLEQDKKALVNKIKKVEL